MTFAHAIEEASVKKHKPTPLISVVMPTYNSQRTVRQCLQSIQRQTYERVETIVVDHYSMDETTQIARQFNARVLFVTRERSTAKNLGARTPSIRDGR